MTEDKIQERINNAIDCEILDLETCMNILINATQQNFQKFSDLDRFLISKSLSTFKWYAENKKDLVIKFSK